MNNRSVKIMDFLANNVTVKVSLLAELLDVSLVTLRRDLDNLGKMGIVKYHHGYVSLEGADITSKRIAFYYLIKRRIARAAAQTISDGETVMIESGSCCTLFAEELALIRKNVTIVTNSLYVTNFVRNIKSINIILLGGCFQPESQVVVGSIVSKYANIFNIDKFFIGTDGFIPEQGFTGGDFSRAETIVELADSARKTFVLTESAKFRNHGAYSLLQFDMLTGVITDDKIPKEAEDILTKNNIQLLKVPSVDEKYIWRQFPGQMPILYKEKEWGSETLD